MIIYACYASGIALFVDGQRRERHLIKREHWLAHDGLWRRAGYRVTGRRGQWLRFEYAQPVVSEMELLAA